MTGGEDESADLLHELRRGALLPQPLPEHFRAPFLVVIGVGVIHEVMTPGGEGESRGQEGARVEGVKHGPHMLCVVVGAVELVIEGQGELFGGLEEFTLPHVFPGNYSSAESVRSGALRLGGALRAGTAATAGWCSGSRPHRML
ncbi:hypothetical protein DAETH_26890 [Deinococcus aetherius]|uniref:Uncharacterized protein n=1 Tax=Deinococcus aetherius TaxID=200252 RepID=A0ABM8AFZ8_9DEIO|nr:hypothetical protein DAETH_26890 [Deinococcus aetherius]